MKFLVDAHLPRRLARAMQAANYDALHTLDLPDGNLSTDEQLNQVSIDEQRIVITKDSDFVDSFLLRNRPYKLLLISTGNITNADLEALFLPQLANLVELFKTARFIELNHDVLIVHQ